MNIGATKILKERIEQIEKHGHDDQDNSSENLKDAALFVTTLNKQYYPKHWNQQFMDKMLNTGYKERLVYAGAFLAAAYDKA